MVGGAPSFIESPYLIIDERGWRLKEDAPEELKKQFDEYMKSLETFIVIEENRPVD